MNSPDAHQPPAAAIQLRCADCGAANRVPIHRLGDAPNCGRCKQPLRSSEPVELSDADFDAVATASPLPLLVDFWAPWCGPCRMMAPAFEQAAAQLAGQALLVKVNSDDNPMLSGRYGIRSIPTLLRLQGGREQTRQSGALPLSAIVAMARG